MLAISRTGTSTHAKELTLLGLTKSVPGVVRVVGIGRALYGN
jgi:hypothetical protein